MLDTNTVSHLIKAHPVVVRRTVAVPMASLCLSAITEGELLFGLAKRPEAKRLHTAVRELLRRWMCCLGIASLLGDMEPFEPIWRGKARYLRLLTC